MGCVTTYELLKSYDLWRLFLAGKITPQCLRDVDIYEDYLTMKENPCKMCIYDDLEEKYKISDRQIRYIIKDMERVIC